MTSERDDALERVQDLNTHRGKKVAGSGLESRAGVGEEGQSAGIAGDDDADKDGDGEVQRAGMGKGNDRRVEVSVGCESVTPRHTHLRECEVECACADILQRSLSYSLHESYEHLSLYLLFSSHFPHRLDPFTPSLFIHFASSPSFSPPL